MSEITKCPICGEAPRIRHGGIFGKEPVAYSHCGAEFTSLDRWNQYAAAMDLARADVMFHKSIMAASGMAHARDELKKAERRVWKVFK